MKKQILSACMLFLISALCFRTEAQIIEVNSIKCFGDSNGELAVIDTFGTAPYTYLWNTAQTTQNIDGLPSGFYSVLVTESGGASQNFLYTLNDPPLLTATYTLSANTSWPFNTGSILINASGGTGWYNYSVYDSTAHATFNQAVPLFDSLASGAYYITITDLYECQNIDTVYIQENAGLAVIMTIDTTACYMSTAPTDVEPDLGAVYPVIVDFDNTTFFTIIDTVTGPRPYVLSTIIDTVASIGGQFEPGFHIATVFAANNTGFRYSWTVDSIVAPISISWTKTNNVCFGNNAGSITSLAEGSWNGFTYSISGPNGFSVASSSAANLFAGEYTITATDWTGCVKSQSVLISQPDEPLHVVFDDPIKPRCPYSADGIVAVHLVDGAIDPVSFTWSNGQSTESIDSLYPGIYTIMIIDSNNCTAQDSIVLMADRRECIYNIVTPNGDGYNDFLDLGDICIGLQMQAEIYNENGKKIATLDETNPRWDASDPAEPPTGTSSTYTVFIQLTKNNQPYKKWAETFSVIYPN
jgi:gliding motility-associated-like protein